MSETVIKIDLNKFNIDGEAILVIDYTGKQDAGRNDKKDQLQA